MERLLGFAINDTSFLPKVVSAHRGIFDIGQGLSDGGWGLGVHRHGEMLVQKRRISVAIDSAAELVRAGARHSVLHVAPRRPGLFDLEHVQPYRYRNWLFAAVGTQALPSGFVDAASSTLRGFTAEGRWMSCPTESAMLTYMNALHRVGELDRTRTHTRRLREAVVDGTSDLRRLADEPEGLDLAIVLHVRDYTYALSMGRPLALRSLNETGSTQGPLGRAGRHVRSVVFMTDAPSDWGQMLPPWSVAEIGPTAEVGVLSLD
jgi:hypothetical protein